jgi:hypothetical protein
MANLEQELEKAVMDKNLVFGLVNQTPIFVIKSRVYYGLKDDPNTGEISKIREGPQLAVLEKMSDKILIADYEKFQQGFVARELQTAESNTRDPASRLIQFAVKEIFPYLRKIDVNALDEVLEAEEDLVPVRQAESAVVLGMERFLDKVIKDKPLANGRESQNDPRLQKILIGENLVLPDSRISAITGGDFAIHEGSVYKIQKVNHDEQFSIGGQKYTLQFSNDFEKFRSCYMENLIRQLSEDALRNKMRSNEEFRKLQEKFSDINILCGKDVYTEKDFGFQKNGSELYVFIEIPEHVLVNPDSGAHYRFNAHRLRIKLGTNERSNKPCLLEYAGPAGDVEGPFYNGRSLCMGNYSFDYLNDCSGKSFAKLLIDAKNVILRGYNSGVGPHHRLNPEVYGHRAISMEEIKRRKLPITNINYQAGGRRYG